MKRFIQGESRTQSILLPACLDDYVVEANPVRVVDVFVDELDLGKLGFEVEPAATGRPGYHPAVLLKLYIYGYLNRVLSLCLIHRQSLMLICAGRRAISRIAPPGKRMLEGG
jgi:transposase